VTLVQLAVVSLLATLAMFGSSQALPQASPGLIGCVAAMGFATAAIQVTMNWAQKTVPATRATIIFAMEPVWAGLVGWLAGEELTLLAISGAVLIVASVLLSQLGAKNGAPG
jgi:drug/metabolite transporter (DMT)-like permease